MIHEKPDFLIKEGKINLKTLQKNHLGIEQFRAKLRESNILSLLDVNEVVFETEGELTIIQKKEKEDSYLLVNNGDILEDNLKEANHDKKWLEQELAGLGHSEIKNIFCAEYTPNRGFCIIDMDGSILNQQQAPENKEPVALFFFPELCIKE
nr:DUF421 domain-containing protein [Parabacteroides pacaensis]